ncbi:MAG: TIGR03915 family putative DNA repair protein [Robiginitalea sp.]
MNNATSTLSFEHTFEGYLSAIYTALSEKLDVTELRSAKKSNALLFNEVRYIPAHREKARRVWDALNKKGTANLRLVYFAFLSENEELLLPIYEYISLLFSAGHSDSPEKLQELRARLSPWAQRVENEKRKMEAALRFQPRQEELMCWRLSPVHNILPLLTRYCRDRFGSAPWMLIDTKRKYGLRKSAAGVEYFLPGVDSLDSSERSADKSLGEREPGFSPRGRHPLQAAV